MKKEDYVSLGVAQLLKEKGYDENCDYYILEQDDDIVGFKKGYLVYRSIILHKKIKNAICAPTLYEAQKWLRIAHNIDVLPIIRTESINKDYCCYIYKDAKIIGCKVAYGDDFYECMNDSLLEALKLINV